MSGIWIITKAWDGHVLQLICGFFYLFSMLCSTPANQISKTQNKHVRRDSISNGHMLLNFLSHHFLPSCYGFYERGISKCPLVVCDKEEKNWTFNLQWQQIRGPTEANCRTVIVESCSEARVRGAILLHLLFIQSVDHWNKFHVMWITSTVSRCRLSDRKQFSETATTTKNPYVWKKNLRRACVQW